MSEELVRQLKVKIRETITPDILGDDPKTQLLLNKYIEDLSGAINEFVKGSIKEVVDLLKSDNAYVSSDANITILPSEKLKTFRG